MNSGESLRIQGNWTLWPGMQCFFFTMILHTIKKDNIFVVPFIEDVRNRYLLSLTFFYIAHRIPFYISYFWKQPLEIIP